MKKLFSYTEKGIAKYNEDQVGISKNVVWVIDGATPLFQKNFFSNQNDVVWLAEQINNRLPDFVDDALSLEDILLQTVQQIEQDAYRIKEDLDTIKEYELPTFTIAMVRIIDQQLEYYVLGDCGALLESSDGTITYLTDKRLERFNERNKQAIITIQSIAPPEERERLKLEALMNTRKLLNKENGYWVGSIDGKGIPHGITGKMEVAKNAKVLLFSDGYASLFELYKLIDIHDFSFNEAAIQNTIKQVRATEEQDSNCVLYPRPKKSDDLTVILIENS
ncbi:protein phosphatase 2C domain-containing protein [Paenibacillus sp. BSR1-1]|uniref:protein phosphatase 2C domain-containing protein n=1 Tax=Paenibacillus sp. BSR1-1 TaxID=3020845 RepID=UPI0025B0B291|nr:protein phosphatase 2C domain-containing protein [Paenibacillus sp. BSR1-1]MDN3019212.1 protein phosphatase 2C domain-containing protein [Paenibacillus sp. BSR1-1]